MMFSIKDFFSKWWSNTQETAVIRDKFLGFTSVSKLGSFNNPFATIRLLACIIFVIVKEEFFCWYKPKKWFLWAIAAAQAAENHADQ